MTDRDNNGRVWGIVWNEVFPWIIIFRTFRIAISFRLLVLGAAGMIAMLIGSYMICWPYGGDNKEGDGRSASTASVVIQETDWHSHLFGYDYNVGWKTKKNSDGVQIVHSRKNKFDQNDPEVTAIWNFFVLPFELATLSRYEIKNLGCSVSIGIWTILVWAFLGTAISRAAVVQLVTGGRMSIREMLFFALVKWRAAFAAPLLPLIGMLFLAIPVLLLGLLLRLGFLAWIGAVAWPIAILSGVVIAILMLGLIFGWPLMISAIATEGSDSFDALSRTYAYIYQRPLHYLFYVCLAILFGMLGWFFLVFFANFALETTQWIANWVVLGANGESAALRGSFAVIRCWNVIFKLLVMGFSATYFWTAAVAIYLLLRRDTDAVELDEVYIPSEATPRGLPKIVTDEQGAPAVEE